MVYFIRLYFKSFKWKIIVRLIANKKKMKLFQIGTSCYHLKFSEKQN